MTGILKKELTLLFREPKFWIPFLLPPFFLLILQFWLRIQSQGMSQAGDPVLLLLSGVLLSTMGISLTADSFAGERERNTLELLLSLPIPLSQIFMGKLLFALLVPTGFSLLWQLLFWLNMGTQDFMLLIQAWVFSISFLFLTNSVSLIISLFSSSVRSAAQTSIFLFLFLLFAVQFLGPLYLMMDHFWVLIPVTLVLFAAITTKAFGVFRKLSVQL